MNVGLQFQTCDTTRYCWWLKSSEKSTWDVSDWDVNNFGMYHHQTTTWDVNKNPINNGEFQLPFPQLVFSPGFLSVGINQGDDPDLEPCNGGNGSAVKLCQSCIKEWKMLTLHTGNNWNNNTKNMFQRNWVFKLSSHGDFIGFFLETYCGGQSWIDWWTVEWA